MAFHVGCPLTCRRICFCDLGFPEPLRSSKGRSEFLDQVAKVSAFLDDPWSLRPPPAFQVLVPRVEPPPPPPPQLPAAEAGGNGAGDGEEALSAQTKRAALQRQAAAASLAAEDYARRFEAGDFPDAAGDAGRGPTGEELVSSAKAMCRICFTGEIEGSERAMKMLSCKNCGKKYHRHCLKSWAQFRDLFHWSSWTCPSCRVCEVCRRAGDPNKFMFCKRCDGAYHCYCQHPPHKNVSSGPFLCPKHTRCHSCGSTVSGSGLSTRWFLGYTCCDACGRLFVKGKYCPVCLKVYRDSESTPMVCCDACHHWVHCDCDGISDEKYQQYQTDGNLFYKCAACRGDCYKVRDGNDAVQELWRRRDKADRDLIASLRAAAGLPSQEDVFSVSPYSDDDDSGPMIYKNDNGLKLSVKGFGENASKSKEYGKKASKSPYSKKKNAKKKGYRTGQMEKVEEGRQNSESIQETQSLNNSLVDEDGLKHERSEVGSVPSKKEKAYSSHLGVQNSKSSEVGVRKEDKQAPVVQIKSSSSGEHFSKSENIKGTKLVIHLGSRNKNTSSPMSEASTGEREHDFTASNGNEEAKRHLANDKKNEVNQGISKSDHSRAGVKLGRENLKICSKGSGLIRPGKTTAEVPELNSKSRKSNVLGDDSSEQAVCREAGAAVGNDAAAFKNSEETATMHHGESWGSPSKFTSTPKDPKPLLKLKFKNPNLENSTWAPKGQEEKNSVKGQRSKRKRPTSLEERTLARDDESGPSQQKNLMDEAMDVNWILRNLGKDAIGKRVEIQQADNSWHKGLITNTVKDASTLTIDFDDGRTKTLQLGKQGIRFISQKQKRSKTVIL